MISMSFSDPDKDQFQDQSQDQVKKVEGVKGANREERKEVLAQYSVIDLLDKYQMYSDPSFESF